MNKPETMGQRLQRLRVELAMTQSQVAEAAGVPLSSLQGWEVDRREPGARALCRLAKVLRVTVEDFCNTIPVEEIGRVFRPAGPTIKPEKPAKPKPAKRKGK